jgi:hypothetical protein
MSKMGIAVVLLLLILPGMVSYAQESSQDSDEVRCEKFLKNESIAPNLKLKATTHITGSLNDNNRQVLKDWPIELRQWKSRKRQIPVKVLRTNEAGRFDLGLIGPGEYRLIAAPDRNWEQIRMVECVGPGDCSMNLLLYPAEGKKAGENCPVQ